jgi:glutamyl-tRNA(Gln) amidotransferase subunit D
LTESVDAMDLSNTKKSEEYSQNSQRFLEKFKVGVGDEVKITTSKQEFSGIILPRYETFSDKYIVLKLKSGYNVGIEINHIEKIEAKQINSSTNKLRPNQQIQFFSDVSNPISNQGLSSQSTSKDQNQNVFDRIESRSHSKKLPKILLISTGGTIASKIDYRTGGVTSLLSASELYSAFPELENHGYIYPEFLFNEYSENITPDHWTIIAERISQAVIKEHFDGIIISHGTDTLHYTSSALSFALKNIPIPVILVGSQRSSDRPSSDAFSNLVGAILFIKDSRYAGIFVCMHHNTSDGVIACHLGTRVRKNHTSKRDAFKSLDSLPFALIDQKGEIKYNDILHRDLTKRKESLKNFISRTTFDDKVFLLKFYPGLNPSFLEAFLNLDYKVIILEGTGLGHINKACFPIISKLINSGIFIFMTSQCIFGRVQMTVYDTGRDLLGLGVIPLSNMGPETAVVKAMWALRNSSGSSEFIRIMTVDYADEMSNILPLVSLKTEGED